MTVKDFFPDYELDQKQNMAFGTWYSRVNLILNHALPIIGEKELQNVTHLDINQIYDQMEASGLKQNTIFGMSAALRSFFKTAQERHLISEDPMKIARTIRQDLTV